MNLNIHKIDIHRKGQRISISLDYGKTGTGTLSMSPDVAGALAHVLLEYRQDIIDNPESASIGPHEIEETRDNLWVGRFPKSLVAAGRLTQFKVGEMARLSHGPAVEIVEVGEERLRVKQWMTTEGYFCHWVDRCDVLKSSMGPGSGDGSGDETG